MANVVELIALLLAVVLYLWLINGPARNYQMGAVLDKIFSRKPPKRERRRP